MADVTKMRHIPLSNSRFEVHIVLFPLIISVWTKMYFPLLYLLNTGKTNVLGHINIRSPCGTWRCSTSCVALCELCAFSFVVEGVQPSLSPSWFSRKVKTITPPHDQHGLKGLRQLVKECKENTLWWKWEDNCENVCVFVFYLRA